MVKTSRLNTRIDPDSRKQIQANADAARQSITDFLHHYGKLLTPEVRAWLDPLLDKYLEGKGQEEVARLMGNSIQKGVDAFDRAVKHVETMISATNATVQRAADLSATIDRESEKLKHLFERLDKERR